MSPDEPFNESAHNEDTLPIQAPHQHLLKHFSLRTIIPNTITALAICSGIMAARQGLAGHYEKAVAFILLAGVMDAIDGRIARALRASTRFGAELDSLADFANFGVFPALILYMWTLKDIPRLGWFAITFYILCCALRLARFNVQLENTSPRHVFLSRFFFSGVPAPAGAFIVMLPFYITFVTQATLKPPGFFLNIPVAVYTIFVGLLMISPWPALSLKNLRLRVKGSRLLMVMIFSIILVTTLFSDFWFAILFLCIAYIFHLPLSLLLYLKKKRRFATLENLEKI